MKKLKTMTKDQKNKLKKLKERIYKWSNGLPIYGDTSEELLIEIKAISWRLQCEVNEEAERLESEVESIFSK